MIDLNLEGKIALVTGASGGIGGAIARALHGAGAHVALSGTRAAAIESLADALGERVRPFVCDLARRKEAQGLINRVADELGPVSVLVNNAGLTADGLLLRMTDEDWDRTIEVNLTAAMALSRASLRGMMRFRWGRIINISSVTGFTGNAGQVNYAASKAGLVGLTRSLAIEVASRGITVNCIAPGLITTDMVAKLPEAAPVAILAGIPVGRPGPSAGLPPAALFLPPRV
ncbi:MAG: SDR family NAD(P)-dependent oxidoreductase, partial [Rhodobacteraceae bacterium]|nr:SDR family NAD(P)-dependent oxidoreductase [Paracoccaceae bacterium]